MLKSDLPPQDPLFANDFYFVYDFQNYLFWTISLEVSRSHCEIHNVNSWSGLRKSPWTQKVRHQETMEVRPHFKVWSGTSSTLIVQSCFGKGLGGLISDLDQRHARVSI